MAENGEGWKWQKLCVKTGIKVYTNDFVLPDCLTKLLTEMKKKGII